LQQDAELIQRIENFERLIASGRDDALVRYSLGVACAKAGKRHEAIEQFRLAIERNAHYSAPYKALGKELAEDLNFPAAIETYQQGILVAERAGDKQSAKEMQVFLRRLEKAQTKS